MPLRSRRVTVGTTPTLIRSGEGAPGSTRLFVRHTGAAPIFVGGPNVSTTNGFEVAAGGDGRVFFLGSGDVLYGVAAGATEIQVFETGI